MDTAVDPEESMSTIKKFSDEVDDTCKHLFDCKFKEWVGKYLPKFNIAWVDDSDDKNNRFRIKVSYCNMDIYEVSFSFDDNIEVYGHTHPRCYEVIETFANFISRMTDNGIRPIMTTVLQYIINEKLKNEIRILDSKCDEILNILKTKH